MASSFSFDTSKFKSTKHMEDKLDRALQGVCRFWDGKIEEHMKLEAPWTDRTSAARNGLAAQHQRVEFMHHRIVMTHAVYYGIYLETKNDGRYAIIRPTLNTHAPKVMGTLVKILDRLDQAGGAA